MKVSINNPCHENWDAMTPNEQGTFCLACQKTVVDFSQKTTEEIKDFFAVLSKSEKVCGRFKNSQIDEMSFNDFFKRFENWILPKKIAVVLFFCFGLTLFSCRTTHDPLMGEVSVDDRAISKERVSNDKGVNSDSTVSLGLDSNELNVERFTMGQAVVIPHTVSNTYQGQCNSKDSVLNQDFIKGEVELNINDM